MLVNMVCPDIITRFIVKPNITAVQSWIFSSPQVLRMRPWMQEPGILPPNVIQEAGRQLTRSWRIGYSTFITIGK